MRKKDAQAVLKKWRLCALEKEKNNTLAEKQTKKRKSLLIIVKENEKGTLAEL